MAEELARYLRGWIGYFGKCQTPSVLEALEQWFRRRLRSAIWKQWKLRLARDSEIGRSAYKLVKSTLSKDWLLWSIFAVSALSTAWTESEVIWLFVLSGFVALVVRQAAFHRSVCSGPSCLAHLRTPWSRCRHNAGDLFWYFAEAGAFVFGSGLAIVPFLYGGVVRELPAG